MGAGAIPTAAATFELPLDVDEFRRAVPGVPVSAVVFDDDSATVPLGWRELGAGAVIDWIRSGPLRESPCPAVSEGWGWLSRWGNRASEGALGEILTAMEAADSALELRRYLSVFQRRLMPCVSDRIVGLAEESDDDGVRSRAYGALKGVRDARIRAVGLRSLRSGLMAAGSLRALESNSERGDHRLIERSLDVTDDDGDRHGLVADLVDFCEEARLAECLGLMLYVYESSPCGMCRARMVELMDELGVTPAWVAEECRFDAMDEVRERFGGPRLGEG